MWFNACRLKNESKQNQAHANQDDRSTLAWLEKNLFCDLKKINHALKGARHVELGINVFCGGNHRSYFWV